MFYLPRIFVYHSKKEIGSESSETFKIMEEKLMKIIMNPALIGTWVFGLALVYISGFEIILELWLQIKILMVVAMSGCHGFFAKTVKNFVNDQRKNTEKFYRYINELPTILLIIIVFLVVFKPI